MRRRGAAGIGGSRLNVHQLLSGAGPHDAVTNQARAYRRAFASWGWGGGDHAARPDRAVEREFRPIRALDSGPEDVLLFHYSAYAPRLADQLTRPQRKVLVSHNITPAQWFWDHEPQTAIHCEIGRAELPRFARAADVAVGVSRFNADELAAAGAARTAVVPILLDPAGLGAPAPPPEGPPHVLFVGRLAPHKRQDLVLRAFALYRAEHAPAARLTLVGAPITPAFAARLRELADRLAPGAVRIESGLAPADLADRWRAAHAFLCLSEHEGFCVPLLEAFHFGVPAIARPGGGIGEVAGDAALLVEDADPAVAAQLLHLVVSDAALAAELRARGRARLAAFDPRAVAERLRSVIESVRG